MHVSLGTLAGIIMAVIAVGGVFAAWRSRISVRRWLNKSDGSGLLQQVQSNVAAIVKDNYDQVLIRVADLETALERSKGETTKCQSDIDRLQGQLETLQHFAAWAQAGDTWIASVHHRLHQEGSDA